jgi:membrane protein YdbS with pleckstrin-like domain
VEQPLVHTRAHTAALTRPIAAALLAVSVLGFVVAVLARTGRPGLSGQVVALVASGFAIWTLIRLVRSVWDWDRTLLLVSEDEIVIQRRGVRRSESIVPLRAVHRLRVRRSIFGRLLGYGTIELAGPRRGSRLRFVPQPERVSAVISTYAGRHDDVR